MKSKESPSVRAQQADQQALDLARVAGENSTWLQRFVDAVEWLCRARPPLDMCIEWATNVSVDGEDRLQSWVLCQKGLPAWMQGIAVLDAATTLADQPVEGEAHQDRGENPNELAPAPPTVYEVRVPLRFWDDHSERTPCDEPESDMCTEVRRLRTQAAIQGTLEQLATLQTDAAFYCGIDGPDECPAGLRLSAAATVRTLKANFPDANWDQIDRDRAAARREAERLSGAQDERSALRDR